MFHSSPPDSARHVLLSYALGLFFVISGYLYRDSYSRNPVPYVWKRFKRLWLPYVGWGLFFLALHNVLLRAHFYSSVTGFQGQPTVLFAPPDFLHQAIRIIAFSGTEQLGGALWFLPMLFAADALFAGISWVSAFAPVRGAEWLRLALVAALAWLGFSDQTVLQLPFLPNGALVAVAAVYIGYWLRRLDQRLLWRWYIAAACVVLMVLAGDAVDFGGNRYASVPAFVGVTAAGAYANFYLAKKLERSRLLVYVGRNTIPVLALHFLAFKLVSLALIESEGLRLTRLAEPAIPGGPWFLAYFVVGLALPVLAKLGWDRLTAGLRSAMPGRVATEAANSQSPGC
jgi:fucose 4-O-acetylase-like acetyltransferase